MIKLSKRSRLFPYISDPAKIDKLLIDPESVHFISTREAAEQITSIIQTYFPSDKKITVTDGTACVGGDAISFALSFHHVNAIEIEDDKFSYLKNNVAVYDLKNVTLYNDDYLNLFTKLKQDVIFLDPPWGGRDYKRKEFLQLELSTVPIEKICQRILDESAETKLIVLKVPLNYDLESFYYALKPYSQITMLYTLTKMYILVIERSSASAETAATIRKAICSRDRAA